jgi:4-hydroxy-tetrahydrodipicolinate synthase
MHEEGRLTKKYAAEGVIVAMVTPFDRHGEINEEATRSLVEWLVDGGVQALFPCGSAGEAPKLKTDERKRLIEIVIDQANSKVKVFPGTGAVSTRETLELTRHAKDAGADAAIVVEPFYFRPSESALYNHYLTISETVDLPIFIYDVPAATGYSLQPRFVAKLAEIENVVGIKDSSGDLLKVLEEIKLVGDRILIFEGAEYHIVSALAQGADGLVTGLGNLCPRFMVELYNACRRKDWDQAIVMQQKLISLLKGILELWDYSSLKEGLSLLGINAGTLREPCLPMNDQQRESLRRVLDEFGLGS